MEESQQVQHDSGYDEFYDATKNQSNKSYDYLVVSDYYFFG